MRWKAQAQKNQFSNDQYKACVYTFEIIHYWIAAYLYAIYYLIRWNVDD